MCDMGDKMSTLMYEHEIAWCKKAIANGIRKINYYSYMSKAGYMAAKEVIESGKTNYLHDVEYAAMQAMKEDVKKAIQIFSK